MQNVVSPSGKTGHFSKDYFFKLLSERDCVPDAALTATLGLAQTPHSVGYHKGAEPQLWASLQTLPFRH